MSRLVRFLLVVVALPVLVYVGDDLVVRYRSAAALDEVSVYLGTRLKNRTVEIFYTRPVTETCVRALFPHFGQRPFCYVRRHPVKLV